MTHSLLKFIVIFGSMIVILIGGMNLSIALKASVYVIVIYSFEIWWHLIDILKALLIPFIYGVDMTEGVPAIGFGVASTGAQAGFIFEIIMVAAYVFVPGMVIGYMALSGLGKVEDAASTEAGNAANTRIPGLSTLFRTQRRPFSI
ncbi:hypothetical protein P8S54_07785 [Thiomicrospira sp. R3]|uniref:hypothetical protein n=1 Tax=Thiomicrospira sp. R3 TaxID=3035472 RepID=UPI00259BA7BD|nr:hypothetical protein [Thiomicrospira sp. R3]WFE68118.1 hypothetical protein P8S54_07785 [Thiomicrospira sp. R3]